MFKCATVLIAMNAVAGLIIACLTLAAYGLPDPQIVGGTDARDGAYPYQASLRRDPSDGNSHFCGGAIISKRYVITTAKCIISFWNPYGVYVVVGSNYLNGTNAVVYQAIDLIVHAGFNNLLHIHDIGLIETSEDIIFNKDVQPIALPTADRNFDNYPLFASGWGSYFDKEGPFPNRLQEVIVKGYSHELCSRYEHVKETHICTVVKQFTGMCYGDAGSPLVADNVLVGLISYSYGPCGRTGAPDVSTRVFSYQSWIKYYTGIS